MPPDWTAITIFLATQTGGLIFFAGMVAFTLRSHDRRLDRNEHATERLVHDVAKLEGRVS